jgi:hypothetical protein
MNGDAVQYYTVTYTAMVGIAPDNRVSMHLNSGACQPSPQVIGAACRSFEFEERAGGHQQRRVAYVL